MSKSMKRVRRALEEAGHPDTITTLEQSTRTAEEAAMAMGCDVAQIVKSLIFKGETTGQLKLIMVSGAHQLNMGLAEKIVGEGLGRADPRLIRDVTGFAIGGVAPIGHLSPIKAFMDEYFFSFDLIYPAAGTPNSMFSISPGDLLTHTDAKGFDAKG